MTLRPPGFNHLQGRYGLTATGAIANQQTKVVNFARLGRSPPPGRSRARTLAQQVMVHGRTGQQRRDGRVIAIEPAIRQDQNLTAFRHCCRRLCAQPVQRLGKPLLALGNAEHRGQSACSETMPPVERAQLVHLIVVDERRAQLDLMAEAACGSNRLCSGPMVVPAHDQLFPDGVHRRVGHLGKECLK